MVIIVSNLNWEVKRNIDQVVEQIALTRVTRFYPTYIHKITGVPLNELFDYLITLVEDDRLRLKWEIRCPDLNCNSIIKRTSKIEDYLYKTIDCSDCDSHLLVTESTVFPIFEIQESYKEGIRDIKKKALNLLKT